MLQTKAVHHIAEQNQNWTASSVLYQYVHENVLASTSRDRVALNQFRIIEEDTSLYILLYTVKLLNLS